MLPTDRSASPAGAPEETARPTNLARLYALHRTGLLDAPPEAAFDRIISLACKLLQVPVALVSVVDDSLQVVKNVCGLTEPWKTGREAILASVCCRHVVEHHAPLQIENIACHPLVAQIQAHHDEASYPT